MVLAPAYLRRALSYSGAGKLASELDLDVDAEGLTVHKGSITHCAGWDAPSFSAFSLAASSGTVISRASSTRPSKVAEDAGLDHSRQLMKTAHC